MPADVSQLLGLASALRNSSTRAGSAAKKVVQDSGHDLKAAAQANAPVRTGALRDSIRVQSRGLRSTVSTDLRYAAYVEYGTGRTAPQPFMNPAADAIEGPLAQKMQAAISDALDL